MFQGMKHLCTKKQYNNTPLTEKHERSDVANKDRPHFRSVKRSLYEKRVKERLSERSKASELELRSFFVQAEVAEKMQP